ncbi:MAG: tRNA (N6-threonylcarbamoyladenosine(37)-N6)-methyltransferase TrmO [Candidatus Hermodarchaeota archaeon]
MKGKIEEYKVKPIGYIRVEGEDPQNMEFFIDIFEQYRTALKQLDKFSHVMVFWWFHENDIDEVRNQTIWTTVPPYGEETPETGIFATRSEFRPNPIAVTTTAVIEVNEKKGVVKIGGIEAFNGTPVVDLKAYFPISDRVRDCHIAPWLIDWPEWLEDGYTWWQEQGFFEEEM